MGNEDFRQRLSQLAESWEERRVSVTLGRRRVQPAQLELLGLIHGWAREALRDVVSVYGSTVKAALSPLESGGGQTFRVEVGESHATFEVMLDGGHKDSWRTTAVVRLSGEPAEKAHSHRPREWSRRRVEEIVLQMVGAFERGRVA